MVFLLLMCVYFIFSSCVHIESSLSLVFVSIHFHLPFIQSFIHYFLYAFVAIPFTVNDSHTCYLNNFVMKGEALKCPETSITLFVMSSSYSI